MSRSTHTHTPDATLDGRKDAQLDVLILSSSLLTDRILLYTEMLPRLARTQRVGVWATSAANPRLRESWARVPATVESFPFVAPYKEFPYNYLRRLNEFAWDYRQRPPSRLSMWRHRRARQQKATIKALRPPASLIAKLHKERELEDWLEGFLLRYTRTKEGEERLAKSRPKLLVCTGPFWFHEPAVVAAARRLQIPVLAFIPSWDNLSTKNRLVFKFDGFLVWSEQGQEELRYFYPQTQDLPVYVVGAPQFDIFFKPEFHIPRESFCRRYGLRSDLPVIVYAVGSPNFIQEHHGALYMADRVSSGDLGDVQMLVRPHPIHDNAQMARIFTRYAPRVALQRTAEPGTPLIARSQDEDEIVQWVNTFRHANVVVNLSSTVAIDAAILDRPVVNLDYDPEPGRPNQQLVRDVNHSWTHFRPVAESGGLWLVETPEELVEAVRSYLAQPDLHREKRTWIVEHVCGYLDGRSGQRMADAILDFISLTDSENLRPSRHKTPAHE